MFVYELKTFNVGKRRFIHTLGMERGRLVRIINKLNTLTARFMVWIKRRSPMSKKILYGTVFVILLIANAAVSQNEQPSVNPDMSDLDEFMAKVMQKRLADVENLRDYVFSERETFEVKVGTKIAAQWSYRHEYLWFVRDDCLVRSPVLIDGVRVSDKEKAAAEEEWINRQREIKENKSKESKNETGIDHKMLFGFKNENRLDFQAFLGFEFEPGRYLYGGEQQFEGRKAIIVEYVPRMNDKKNDNKKDKIGGLFEKSVLVTMLISPDEHQILQMTFDNVGLEFLPVRWLVRMNDVKASMVMDNPKGDTWFPREISAHGSVSTAGTDTGMDAYVNYSSEFYAYTKSQVDVNIRFNTDGVAEDTLTEDTMAEEPPTEVIPAEEIPTDVIPAEETLIEVRFRGNFTISDETLLQMAGIEVGLPADVFPPETIRQTLLGSGRFEWVEVTKRYRSIARNDKVVIVITVKEKEYLKNKFMVSPIFGSEDEYGFTYGLRGTTKNLLGLQERISIPLTWGGVRRVKVVGEFELRNPVVQTLTVAVGASQKEHPHYEKIDFRKEVNIAVKHRLKLFEVNAQSGWTDINFDGRNGNFVTFGTGMVFDTRQDVIFPRNSVYADITWKRLSFLDAGQGINVYTVDFRGYKGLIGQTILAGQFYYNGADGTLPDYEQPFLGGAATLRGYESGVFIGNNIATASLELRQPLDFMRRIIMKTPLSKISDRINCISGVALFIDSGAAYDYGVSLRNAKFMHSTGIGAFILIMGFGIKVDVGYNMHDDVFRAHFSSMLRF